MRVAFILVVIVLPNYDYRQPMSWIVIEFQRFYFHKWFTSGGQVFTWGEETSSN